MRIVEAIRLALQAEGQQRGVEWFVRAEARAMRWYQVSAFGRGYWERFAHVGSHPTRGNRSVEALESLIGQAERGEFTLVPFSHGDVERLDAAGLLAFVELVLPGTLDSVELPEEFKKLLD